MSMKNSEWLNVLSALRWAERAARQFFKSELWRFAKLVLKMVLYFAELLSDGDRH